MSLGTTGPFPSLRRAAGGALRDNRFIIGATVVFAGVCLVVEAVTGVAVAARLRPVSLAAMLLWWALPLSIFALLPAVVWFALTRLGALEAARRGCAQKSPPPLRKAWSRFEHRLTASLILRIFVCVTALGVFFQAFSGLKGAIPVFHPFAWDEAFMRLDRMLHFGHDPWRLLHPLFGFPGATRALDLLYYSWFPVTVFGALWFAWKPDGLWRRQFFLSFLLSWALLGNGAALLFSSAGPCYYDLVTGSLGPYEDLMTYLRNVHLDSGLISLQTQALLLEGYSPTEVNPVQGIAAMPSLHVAIPFLFAVALLRYSPVAATGFAIFGFMILLGSVHLAWHYAVDGYASILAIPVIWWISGWIARWGGDGETWSP